MLEKPADFHQQMLVAAQELEKALTTPPGAGNDVPA